MIVGQCHGFSTVMCRRNQWCCIILAPLIYYENVIIKHYYPCTGLRQKYKAPRQVLTYCSAIHRSIYIALASALATRFSSMYVENCVATRMQPSLQCSCTHEWGMLIRYIDYMWVQNTCMVSKILQRATSWVSVHQICCIVLRGEHHVMHCIQKTSYSSWWLYR